MSVLSKRFIKIVKTQTKALKILLSCIAVYFKKIKKQWQRYHSTPETRSLEPAILRSSGDEQGAQQLFVQQTNSMSFFNIYRRPKKKT